MLHEDRGLTLWCYILIACTDFVAFAQYVLCHGHERLGGLFLGKGKQSLAHTDLSTLPLTFIMLGMPVTKVEARNKTDDALRNIRDEVINGVRLFESDRVSVTRAARLTNNTSDLIEWARYMPGDTPQAAAYTRALLRRQRLELLFDRVGADSKRAWRVFWKPVLGK